MSHLGDNEAKAYSRMQTSIRSGRLTPMEATLADLVVRDLDGIEARATLIRTSPGVAADALLAALIAEGDDSDAVENEDSEPIRRRSALSHFHSASTTSPQCLAVCLQLRSTSRVYFSCA